MFICRALYSNINDGEFVGLFPNSNCVAIIEFRRLTVLISMALGTDLAASRISSAQPLTERAITLLTPQ